MSDQEAGPSRRSGRRVARIRYDQFQGFDQLPEELAGRPPSTDEDSVSEDQADVKGNSKAKGKKKEVKKARSRPVSDEEFHLSEDIDEEVEEEEEEELRRYDSVGIESQEDEDMDEDEEGGERTRKPARKRRKDLVPQTDNTPKDEADLPDDKAIVDYNFINDVPAVIGHRYNFAKALDRNKSPKLGSLSNHPIGLTTLKEKPHFGKLSQVELNKGDGWDSQRRFRHSTEIMVSSPLEIPWDLWTGEAWWNECWTYDKKGKASWISRFDVDVGLSTVGRVTKKELRVLSEEESRAYIPSRTGKSELTLHLGLDDQQPGVKAEVIQSRVFDSRCSGGPTQKQSQLFDAGAYVSGLEWCPMSEAESSKRNFAMYLAVSTLDPAQQPNQTGGLLPDLKGSLQIWSVSPDGSNTSMDDSDDLSDPAHSVVMRCEVVLCFDGGPVIDFKWMPLGCFDKKSKAGVISKIGIISAVLTDGSIRLFAIPDPAVLETAERKYIQVEPLLTLGVEDAAATTLDWGGAGRFAVGFNNGSLAYWDNMVELLRGEEKDLSPTDYFPIHSSAIKTVVWARMPAADADNRTRLDLPAPYLISAGWDGNFTLIDLRDTTLLCDVEGQSRFATAAAWNRFLDLGLWTDQEYHAVGVRLRRLGRYMTSRLDLSEGPILSMGTSDYHPMLVIGGADGSVRWTNSMRGALRLRSQLLMGGIIYQLDHNRNDDEYRMVDKIKPTPHNFSSKLALSTGGQRVIAAGWSPSIGITRIAWNSENGIGRAGILASGSGSGLCRLDFLRGHEFEKKRAQIRNKLYGSTLPKELEGEEIDLEEDDSDDV